jgi:hypothetical protein
VRGSARPPRRLGDKGASPRLLEPERLDRRTERKASRRCHLEIEAFGKADPSPIEDLVKRC